MTRADLVDALVVEAHALIPPPPPAPLRHRRCGVEPCAACRAPAERRTTAVDGAFEPVPHQRGRSGGDDDA